MAAKLTSSASPYLSFIYPPLSLGRHTHFLTQAYGNQVSSTSPLTGVSRVHSILHSFAYPLKPLTQASISIQPMSILHATHNNVLPYLDVSHLESFSAAISIWVSHTRNPLTAVFSIRVFYAQSSSPPSFPSGYPTPGIPSPLPFPSGCSTPGVPLRRHFHPDVSPPGIILCRHFPSGCLAPGISLRRHFPSGVSHIRNPVRRCSIFSGCLTSGILPNRPSTFSGYLTPGILSVDVSPSPDVSHPEFYPPDVPPFSSSLEHFL